MTRPNLGHGLPPTRASARRFDRFAHGAVAGLLTMAVLKPLREPVEVNVILPAMGPSFGAAGARAAPEPAVADAPKPERVEPPLPQVVARPADAAASRLAIDQRVGHLPMACRTPRLDRAATERVRRLLAGDRPGFERATREVEEALGEAEASCRHPSP